MQFSVLTLFPELIEQNFLTSITGRAASKGILKLQTVQIRDFAVNAYGQVDDTLYGGGRGMLLRPEPVYDSFQSLTSGWSADRLANCRRLFLSPKGPIFDQAMAEKMATADDLIFLCGHYEGVDSRVIDALDFQEVSLGNFILTGGELAASVMIDAIARLIPGVLPDAAAHREESISSGLLEERQYTRPQVWMDRGVPEVLLSGDQAKIDRYRQLSRLLETATKRPDLIQDQLSLEDWSDLLEFL